MRARDILRKHKECSNGELGRRMGIFPQQVKGYVNRGWGAVESYTRVMNALGCRVIVIKDGEVDEITYGREDME